MQMYSMMPSDFSVLRDPIDPGIRIFLFIIFYRKKNFNSGLKKVVIHRSLYCNFRLFPVYCLCDKKQKKNYQTSKVRPEGKGVQVIDDR